MFLERKTGIELANADNAGADLPKIFLIQLD
jgi:hypothetical protein